MKASTTPPTVPGNQSRLAEMLGISRGQCSQNVKAGMPTHSLEAAQAWRRANLCPMRSKQPPRPPPPPQAPPPPSPAVVNAQALMQAAGLVLEAGGSIETLVPALRASMRAVPPPERDRVGLDLAVMNVLLADVLAHVAADEAASPGSTTSTEPLSDHDAQWMGEFWYSAACGEWVLNPPP